MEIFKKVALFALVSLTSSFSLAQTQVTISLDITNWDRSEMGFLDGNIPAGQKTSANINVGPQSGTLTPTSTEGVYRFTLDTPLEFAIADARTGGNPLDVRVLDIDLQMSIEEYRAIKSLGQMQSGDVITDKSVEDLKEFLKLIEKFGMRTLAKSLHHNQIPEFHVYHRLASTFNLGAMLDSHPQRNAYYRVEASVVTDAKTGATGMATQLDNVKDVVVHNTNSELVRQALPRALSVREFQFAESDARLRASGIELPKSLRGQYTGEEKQEQRSPSPESSDKTQPARKAPSPQDGPLSPQRVTGAPTPEQPSQQQETVERPRPEVREILGVRINGHSLLTSLSKYHLKLVGEHEVVLSEKAKYNLQVEIAEFSNKGMGRILAMAYDSKRIAIATEKEILILLRGMERMVVERIPQSNFGEKITSIFFTQSALAVQFETVRKLYNKYTYNYAFMQYLPQTQSSSPAICAKSGRTPTK